MLDDQEVRHLAISLLLAPTARDRQTRIGASDLSDQCDFCLAVKLAGGTRDNPITDQFWLGRTWGTAQHGILDDRVKNEMVAHMVGLHPDALAEVHTLFADIEGYGLVGGTIDLDLGPDEDQIIDWKSTTRHKLCILIDYLRSVQGLEPLFGRKHRSVAAPGTTMISEAKYADELEKMAYKYRGYYGQQNLYMHGRRRKRASLVMLCRDGNGMFDNPAGARYEDPKAVHDVYVVSFDYDQAYAEALIARGAAIIAHLNAGGVPADFTHHPLCYPCRQDSKDAAKAPDIDIEATFGSAA